jgi:hypothetical protein
VVALLTLPGLLTLYLGFNSGGFFVDVTGLAAVVLALALAVRITLAERPFAGVSGPVVVAAGALALYAVLALVSASWSGSPARALLEFDRALVYLLVLVLLGSLSVTPERLAWALRAFALAAVAVCLAGLVSRVAPDVLPTATDVATERLSYPVSYWNALGLLAAIGMIVCLHLTSERRSPGSVRVAGAAAVPALAATLLLTFSRGAIGVAIVGLLAYAVLARSRGTVFGLVATVPPAALAVVAAYRAELLADADYAGRYLARARSRGANSARRAAGRWPEGDSRVRRGPSRPGTSRTVRPAQPATRGPRSCRYGRAGRVRARRRPGRARACRAPVRGVRGGCVFACGDSRAPHQRFEQRTTRAVAGGARGLPRRAARRRGRRHVPGHLDPRP